MLPSLASLSVLHHAASVDIPTVVCLHSSGSSASQWKRLMEAQQGAYRFVAVDFFGHGRTPRDSSAPYTLQREADGVWQALASIAGPVHLVGHSYGGAVALDLAARFPDRVASVCAYEPVLFALLDPASIEHDEITTVGLSIVRNARAGRLEAAAATFIDYWNGTGAWNAMSPELRTRVEARIVPVASHFQALFDDPLPLQRVRLIGSPILVLHGDRSPAPARAVCRCLESLDAVHGAVLPGLGHMGPVTHPEIVNRYIAAHLQSVATPTGRLRLAA